ncbi:MAG TPA: shikimate dehydrogenase [Crocinitomicaceae bacterium]|nr:shikimate dehydrogenase [Crocinitomicaceae bacterium]
MKKYGLIGKSLSHSFSKAFFTSKFLQNKIQASYENIELGTIGLIENLFQENYCGFNVTIPYKEKILPYLDEIDDVAKDIGAVNVVRIKNGKTCGYNTDAFGFHQSIKPFLTNKHERAIIFGTGGASKAIEYVLKKLGVNVIFISRTPEGDNQFGYDEVNENMLKACRLIINCTPVGTFPNIKECINIPFSELTEHHLVIDLIYNPVKTLFLKKAEENNAMILNGESMLKHQALKSWEIWNG